MLRLQSTSTDSGVGGSNGKHILIVGQGPSKSGVGKKPLDGKGSGDALAKMAGLPPEKLFEVADVVNLLDDWHGKNGKGDKFPMKLAAEKASELYQKWPEYEWVVLLGSNVSAAFHFESEPLVWQKMDDCYVSIVPHPSGINRFYNQKQNVDAAITFLRDLFHQVSDGVFVSKPKSERAEYCTKKLKEFETRWENWADFAAMLVECERDQLYLEVGSKTWDDWVRQHAPRSYTLCYTYKAQFKSLIGRITIDKLRTYHSETAKWAAKPKNLSPAVLAKPEVQEALALPKKKAIQKLKEILPEEHIEETKNSLLKFEASQYEAIAEAYSAYKVLKDDEKARMEDFFEFLAQEWMDSVGEDGETFRFKWNAVKEAVGDQMSEKEVGQTVAAV